MKVLWMIIISRVSINLFFGVLAAEIPIVFNDFPIDSLVKDVRSNNSCSVAILEVLISLDEIFVTSDHIVVFNYEIFVASLLSRAIDKRAAKVSFFIAL